jgi:hypothetical protein
VEGEISTKAGHAIANRRCFLCNRGVQCGEIKAAARPVHSPAHSRILPIDEVHGSVGHVNENVLGIQVRVTNAKGMHGGQALAKVAEEPPSPRRVRAQLISDVRPQFNRVAKLPQQEKGSPQVIFPGGHNLRASNPPASQSAEDRRFAHRPRDKPEPGTGVGGTNPP